MFLFVYLFMRKLSVFFSVIFGIFLWFSFAIVAALDAINWEDTNYTASYDEHYITNDTTPINDEATITRTVIPAVPKTWPSGTLIWIILATLTIFGGYIYIRKRADI